MHLKDGFLTKSSVENKYYKEQINLVDYERKDSVNFANLEMDMRKEAFSEHRWFLLWKQVFLITTGVEQKR